jgi:succinate dehydrogenase / fumarate reductase, cytochrome b subunit
MSKTFKNIGIAQIIRYRLPWAGKVSILHRVSGILLFLALPFLLYLFEQSVTSEYSFLVFQEHVNHIVIKLLLLGFIWAYLHHFCAGIRFLLLDMHKGVEKYTASKTAISVIVISMLLTAAVALKMFGLM